MKLTLLRVPKLIISGGLLLTSVFSFANPAPVHPLPTPENVIVISGKIVNECGQGVENVLVAANGTQIFTDANGHYDIPGITAGTDVQLCIDVQSNPLSPFSNQVNVCDLRRVYRHVLGQEPLTSPVRLTASDVNHSGNITTFDIVILRNEYVLNQLNGVGEVPVQYFMTSSNPLAVHSTNSLDNCFNIQNVQQSITDVDFVRVAVGDADASGQICSPVSAAPFHFNVTDHSFTTGETFTADIAAESPVQAFQFGLQFPGLVINSITDDNSANILSSVLGTNTARLAWMNSLSTLQQPVLHVNFTAETNGDLSQVLSFTPSPTPPVHFIQECLPMTPSLQFSVVDAPGLPTGKIMVQFAPNPWTDQTVLTVGIPTATEAQLRITDITGKLLYNRSVTLAAGTNQLVIDKQDIPATGVLFYRLNTSLGNWSGKLEKF